MYQLLKGLRVVECGSFIAGPSCALHLQQMGAEVIRIDPIGGGPDFHRWPLTEKGDSLYWEGLNKGKKSIAIDLSRPAGRELAVRLITAPGRDAGLFVTNFPIEGFLAHSRLSALRHDLITLRVQGWADGEPAVDYTVNAALGVPFMTGPADRGDEPVNHVLPAWDLLAGAYGAFAILAAERHRRETGEGQEVLVPLSDLAISTMGHLGQIAEVMSQGDRQRIGNDLYGAFGRDFTSADGQKVMVVAITPRQWSGLVDALNLGADIAALEASLEMSFARDEGIRFQNRHVLFPLFASAISVRNLADLRARFEARGVCWAPYHTLSDALTKEPRFSTDRPLFATLEHPSGHRYPAPGAAATFTQLQRGSPERAPRLGEHTDAILEKVLNLSHCDIGALHEGGIVSSALRNDSP